MKLIRSLIEAYYWSKIFLSPIFIALLILGVIYSIADFQNKYFWLLLPAAILGIVWAEKARKSRGTSVFVTSFMSRPMDEKKSTDDSHSF